MQRMKRDLCQTLFYVTSASQKRVRAGCFRAYLAMRQRKTRSAGSQYQFSHTSMTQGRDNTCESCPTSFFWLKSYYDADIDDGPASRAYSHLRDPILTYERVRLAA